MDKTNYQWSLEQDFSGYAGKWIAIVDKQVVGISDSISKLVLEVKELYPDKPLFLTKVTNGMSLPQPNSVLTSFK